MAACREAWSAKHGRRRRIDRGYSIWKKWDSQRELLLGFALGCWIPVEDLHSFLNAIPGSALTKTDVAQRLRALEDEKGEFGNEDLRDGCLAIFEREKADGTELPAIIQLLRDHLEREEDLRAAIHDCGADESGTALR